MQVGERVVHGGNQIEFTIRSEIAKAPARTFALSCDSLPTRGFGPLLLRLSVDYLRPSCRIRTEISFLMSDLGGGLSIAKWSVPLVVVYPETSASSSGSTDPL